MKIEIKRLNTAKPGYKSQLDKLLAYENAADEAVIQTVRGILADVKKRGDQAVVEYTNRYDRVNVTGMADLEISQQRMNAALKKIPHEHRTALEKAADRIKIYHERQKSSSWTYTESDGTVLGQQVTPLDRVGLYVPGGKASYPSSVLMNAIPAKVAGVEELIMVVPAPDHILNDMVLAAASIARVDRIITIGGAQAVAALAYGTETIPHVDKIVGPGNIYVATAKGMVYGVVGIDMIAGPSEILIICDGDTSPDWIAMDLFSQAEHDEDARAVLVSPKAEFFDQVYESMVRLLPDMERSEIIRKSLEARAMFIQVRNLDEAADIANHIAPEHLELSVADPEMLVQKIKHAGAIFMGRYTAEAIGDYCAGPNHVLPTARTARFFSPLGVYDFQKRSSLIKCSEKAANELGRTASVLARGEGLTAHARSAEYRFSKESGL